MSKIIYIIICIVMYVHLHICIMYTCIIINMYIPCSNKNAFTPPKTSIISKVNCLYNVSRNSVYETSDWNEKYNP